MVELIIGREDNLDILASSNHLLYLSEHLPSVGDIIIFDGLRVTVTNAERIDNYKHNVKVGVSGDDIPKMRDRLTYRVSCKLCNNYATHKVSIFEFNEREFRLMQNSFFVCNNHLGLWKDSIIMELECD